MLDDIFARCYCSEGSDVFPLTKMLQIEYVKAVFPDEVLFSRVTKTSLPPGRNDTGKRSEKLRVQGSIETIRDHEVITLVRAEALFIVCNS